MIATVKVAIDIEVGTDIDTNIAVGIHIDTNIAVGIPLVLGGGYMRWMGMRG